MAHFFQRFFCMGAAVLELINSAPSCASAALDITALIVWDMLRTAPLFNGCFSLPPMNNCPPARLRAWGSDKYDTSL